MQYTNGESNFEVVTIFTLFNKGLAVVKVTSGFCAILRTVAQKLAFRVAVVKFAPLV